jgi:DHA2 family multidrug resistance protein
VFFINIPVGILSLALTTRFVHDPPAFEQERKSVRSADGKIRIDGLGIALIGVGSAAMEVMLDRGQIDDWFGSRFISWMFGIAITCLLTAVVWELRQSDPVIELRLLRSRNFAIANLFYFLFGFGLFASTTMIPQLLQTLYGYRAIDAGLVLGPGAFVITLLAPVGAQLVQRGLVQPRILLLGALLVVGISFLHYSHLNLDTDYNHYAWARALQGLGYAFFFVPLSMIAYSQLKPEQNNKASSLTNFFRNWGGSFGIAFINTASERRLSFHQATVGANLPASSPGLQERVEALGSYLQAHGMAHADALNAAYTQVYARLQAQAHFLAFMDCFWVIGVVTLVAAPVVLLTKSFRLGGKAPAGH